MSYTEREEVLSLEGGKCRKKGRNTTRVCWCLEGEGSKVEPEKDG
jgi:hypothetical protein